jgi:hypothetical protein
MEQAEGSAEEDSRSAVSWKLTHDSNCIGPKRFRAFSKRADSIIYGDRLEQVFGTPGSSCAFYGCNVTPCAPSLSA